MPHRTDSIVKERVITKERVVVGEVAALLTDRMRLRQKRKAGEHERNEKERGQRRAVH